ncbi:MAG TPA: tryptophan 2,3-dioxygenase family protein [Thermoanaerobaculia bacterium]|jgi:tryptophan 2,3-dioxygenase|nr:tryptophan 2,3-dioxygenase family protein [Thermoanaerobaculia bacterium]
MPLTYPRYLQLEALLSLQQPHSEGPEHDEMLFIVIHQVYELWFKQILHELAYLKRSLLDGDTPTALATLKRVLTILKVLVSQIDVLETMTPIAFNSFRDRLDAASGFESAQFRELELTLGHKRPSVAARYPEGSAERRRLDELMAAPSVWDCFLRYLVLEGYTMPHAALERLPHEPTAESPEVQEVLLDIYRHDPMVAQICERFVDLDEGMQEWRYRHVKMVERTIGTKRGTGGSTGAEYLRTTIGKPLFPDLWAIRVRL